LAFGGRLGRVEGLADALPVVVDVVTVFRFRDNVIDLRRDRHIARAQAGLTHAPRTGPLYRYVATVGNA
jgi:hypothetical protein